MQNMQNMQNLQNIQNMQNALYLATLPQPPANEDLRFLKPGYLRKRSKIEYSEY